MSIGITRKEMMKEIRLSLGDRPNLFGVFGFGSFFRSNKFNDIDVLVVVKDSCGQPLDEFYGVKFLLDKISKQFEISIDITFLSYTEYARKPLKESDTLVPII